MSGIKIHVTIDEKQVQEAARLAARLFRSEYAAAILAEDVDEDSEAHSTGAAQQFPDEPTVSSWLNIGGYEFRFHPTAEPNEGEAMSDQINAAARALSLAPWEDLTVTEQVRWLNAAGRLAEAGLLASPEHDAALAAKALRDFANGTRFPNDWVLFRHDDGSVVTVPDLLRETADRIEREGGDDV